MPSIVIAIAWMLASFFCIYNVYSLIKYNHIAKQVSFRLLLEGLVLLFVGGWYFSAVYFYFTEFVTEVTTRQIWVRYGLLSFAILILFWNVRIFRRGK